jgi:hypothetical protein
MNDDSRGNHAGVNGLRMYYESHGDAEPLILLHGGIGAIEMFGEVLPLLAEGRQVIGVDLQAHGRTADIDRPMAFEAMADDVAALIEHLSLERADVMGYSLGGADSVRTSHAVEFFELLGGGKRDAGWEASAMSKARLAVLPGTTHYDILSPTLAPTVAPFLDSPMAEDN